MDTRPPKAADQGAAVAAQLVAQRLETIRRYMPETLACIRDRAEHFGEEAYALVRRGLRGEPGCFYAVENGHVMGQPAGLPIGVLRDAAGFLVEFGCTHVCIWPERVWQGRAAGQDGGGQHGAD